MKSCLKDRRLLIVKTNGFKVRPSPDEEDALLRQGVVAGVVTIPDEARESYNRVPRHGAPTWCCFLPDELLLYSGGHVICRVICRVTILWLEVPNKE